MHGMYPYSAVACVSDPYSRYPRPHRLLCSLVHVPVPVPLPACVRVRVVFGQPDVRGRLFVRCSVKMPRGGLVGEVDAASHILDTLLPKDGSQGRTRARKRAATRSGIPTPPAVRGTMEHFGQMGSAEDEFFF